MASAFSRFVRHFVVLFKKNMLQKIRKPFTTLMELSFPIQTILIMYLVMVLTGQSPGTSSDVIIRDSPINIVPLSDPIPSDKPLTWSATSLQVENFFAAPFMKHLAADKRFKATPTQIERDEFVQLYKEYFGHLQFRDKEVIIANKSSHLVEMETTQNQTSKFYKSGFIQFLNVLQANFMKYKYPQSNLKLQLQLKEFPLKTKDSIFTIMFQFMYPLYFCLSAITLSSPFMIAMISEKKAKLKAALQMMGCNMVSYNASWWAIMAIEALVNSVLLTVLLAITGLLKSNLFLFFIVYSLFLLSIVPLTSMSSSLFNDPKVASIVVSLTYMGFVLCWFIVRFLSLLGAASSSISSTFQTLQYFLNFLSPYAFAEFAFYFCGNKAMTFSNFSDFSEPYNVSLGIAYIFLDLIVYTLIAIYIEKVAPGQEHSRPSHPCFCLFPSFWRRCCKASQKLKIEKRRNEENMQAKEAEAATIVELEEEQANQGEAMEEAEEENIGIELNQISKVFTRGIIKRKSVTAVENLSLKIKQGEIFALLGHNGAGKTTTISMITGCSTPTFGTAKIHGLSIDSEMDIIRQNMGVCWQEDICFDKLTAHEHLQLFATIKDVPPASLKDEITARLESIGLTESVNRYVSDFSGGMKRKMSFIIAMIGDSRIVVLDEPTTGMDAVSRRKIWSILQECKREKTILLTTHSMEEADLLADHIAIMKKGKLEVCGNALSLKNHYGVGYSLHCILSAEAAESAAATIAVNEASSSEARIDRGGEEEAMVAPNAAAAAVNTSDEDKITEFIKRFIPNCTRQEDVNTMNRRRTNEVFYVLPYQSVNLFPTFLREFEKNLAALKISTYGLSVTTLEEVFLKINEDVLNSEDAENNE